MKALFTTMAAAALWLCLAGTLPAATVTDRAGRVIPVDGQHPFTRIISLYPAHTENLFSLGLDEEIIGVSRGDDYPAQVKNKPRFHYREDVEKFIAARPGLVLIRPMIERAVPEFVRALEAAGITVASLQPRGMDEMYGYWRDLGHLTGRAAEAEAMIRRFERELKAIRARVAAIPPRQRKTVYFEAIHKKMKTFAPRSMAIFVLTEAGGVNAAADAQTVRRSNIAYYGKERLMAKGESIDVFLAQRGRMNPVTLDEIYGEPGFAAIKAVRDHRVHLVSETLVSRPTMRLLTGIKTIHAILYQETPVP